jgi:putative flippase GtrA
LPIPGELTQPRDVVRTAAMRRLQRFQPLSRDFSAFVVVGLLVTAVHYSVLVGLVETQGVAPVPATLAGYVMGGIVSYLLNRRFAFRSDRPHREAGWRFVVVAGVGFVLTGLLMSVLSGRIGLPYMAAQVLTTGAVLFWSFLAHRLWTFPPAPL